MLPKVGARISMSHRGNCYDNASMERLLQMSGIKDKVIAITGILFFIL
jgi:transposase InsO family protein